MEQLYVLLGNRIKLTVKNGSFIGIVRQINPNKTIVLSDVVDVAGGREYPGERTFFGHEILNMEPYLETKADNGQEPILKGCLAVKESQPFRKGLFEEDDTCVNYEIIDTLECFGSALMDINQKEVIGVAAFWMETNQDSELCWVPIATNRTVYLFDIIQLGAVAFKNGLTMILENEHIVKVIHDCRGIARCLMAQFKVKLANVFDTQVADTMYFYNKTGGFLPDRVSTLKEVVRLYLKVPSSRLSSLEMKPKFTKMMAVSVIHLQPVRLVLRDTLMVDYKILVDSYLSSSQKVPGEVEHTSMGSVMELPKELKKLEHMHQERKEQALVRYPVTEQGLLDRFNPRPQPPLQSSSPEEKHTQDPKYRFNPKPPHQSSPLAERHTQDPKYYSKAPHQSSLPEERHTQDPKYRFNPQPKPPLQSSSREEKHTQDPKYRFKPKPPRQSSPPAERHTQDPKYRSKPWSQLLRQHSLIAGRHTQDPEYQTQPKSRSTAALEPPSAKADPSYSQPSGSATWMTSVRFVQSLDIHPVAMFSAFSPAAQVPVSAPMKDLGK